MKERNKLKFWKIKFAILLLAFLPSFTDYFVNKMNGTLVPGIKEWELMYFCIVFITVLVVSGRTILIWSISAASLISISVVFMGAFIACLKVLKGFTIVKVFEYSPHYISLLITMLSVIPIAIAIIATIPFKEYEVILLNRMRGITLVEKVMLISARVFNHVVYTVIPSIILVKREEKIRKTTIPPEDLLEDVLVNKLEKFKKKVIRGVIDMFNIGVYGICYSIEYIPLWAIEVADLPCKKTYKGAKT